MKESPYCGDVLQKLRRVIHEFKSGKRASVKSADRTTIYVRVWTQNATTAVAFKAVKFGCGGTTEA
jgi:hypothetical protein